MIASAPERPRDDRRRLGQYFTPPAVASFLASLFTDEACSRERVRVLDAGAGSGRLTEALVKRLLGMKRRPNVLAVTAWEMDAEVWPDLEKTLERCREMCAESSVVFEPEVRRGNFILEGTECLEPGIFGGGTESAAFDLAIVNPPYRKLSSDSAERAALRVVGVETSNLYTAFLALITRLLRDGGELSCITPRSFCNGAYFQRFRHDFLSRMEVRRLHLIESRTKTFSDDAVLQETLILHAIRTSSPSIAQSVALSESPGSPTGEESVRFVPRAQIVRPGDAEVFIHLPSEGSAEADTMAHQPFSLKELGLEVSTGKVVPFRSRDQMHASPGEGDVPLLWATHLDGRGGVRWPIAHPKRPEAFARCDGTMAMISPPGCYVVVKRLTAKEERRRVVASVVDTRTLGVDGVAFENHLNYFHARGRGLDAALAGKLCDYLNSEFVDRWFRLFNGHTQVNATDLRALRFPDFGVLPVAGSPVPETDFMLNETPDSDD